MSDIKQMTDAAVKFRDDRGWKHEAKDCAIGLTVEASEAAELFLYKTDEEIATLGEKWREDLGDELSDVLYWVLLTAEKYGVDMSDAFPRKLEKSGRKYPIVSS